MANSFSGGYTFLSYLFGFMEFLRFEINFANAIAMGAAAGAGGIGFCSIYGWRFYFDLKEVGTYHICFSFCYRPRGVFHKAEGKAKISIIGS